LRAAGPPLRLQHRPSPCVHAPRSRRSRDARLAPTHPIPTPPVLKLDLVQTVAFAGLVLFAGYGVRRLVRPLARNNVPAPVVGGLLAAVLITLARRGGAGVV